MAWLTYGNDKDPGAIAAAAGMAVRGNGVDSSIMNYVDPWDRAIAGVNQDVEEYLKRKQQREIADWHNQREIEQNNIQDKYRQAQEKHLNALGGTSGNGSTAGKYAVTLPDGSTVMVTGNAALRQYERQQQSKKNDPAKVLTGHSAGEWADLYNRSTSGHASEFRDDPNNPNAYLGTFGSNEKGEPKFSSIPKKMFAELQRNSLGGQAPASSGNGAAAPLQSDVNQAAAAMDSEQTASGTTSGGQGGYIPGRKYGGKRYLGGDPEDANSWQ